MLTNVSAQHFCHPLTLFLKPFRVTFEARYTGISYETVVIEVNTVPSPLPASGVGPMTVALYLGSGQCTGKGCVEGWCGSDSLWL